MQSDSVSDNFGKEFSRFEDLSSQASCRAFNELLIAWFDNPLKGKVHIKY